MKNIKLIESDNGEKITKVTLDLTESFVTDFNSSEIVPSLLVNLSVFPSNYKNVIPKTEECHYEHSKISVNQARKIIRVLEKFLLEDKESKK